MKPKDLKKKDVLPVWRCRLFSLLALLVPLAAWAGEQNAKSDEPDIAVVVVTAGFFAFLGWGAANADRLYLWRGLTPIERAQVVKSVFGAAAAALGAYILGSEMPSFLNMAARPPEMILLGLAMLGGWGGTKLFEAFATRVGLSTPRGNDAAP